MTFALVRVNGQRGLAAVANAAWTPPFALNTAAQPKTAEVGRKSKPSKRGKTRG